MKTVYVQFKDAIYNYYTLVNALLNEQEIMRYFKGRIFDMGCENFQRCIDAKILD